MAFKSKSNWGDWIDSQLKGPEWSPYAQAIAEHYPIQVPWFYTLPSNLVEGVTFQDRKTVITAPQQHDVLIFGAYAIVRGASDDDGNRILLQITHEETGIPWVVPNIVGAAPLPAIAGSITPAFAPNPTAILKLPEAFFLPRHNRLKLDWAQAALDIGDNLDALITFVGVQLIGGAAPKEINMPDGTTIPIGSRLPWFISLVLGSSSRFQQWINWNLNENIEGVQFTSAQDCDIEIHDVYFSQPTPSFAVTLVTKLTEMGARGIWTPQRSPITAWAGSERKVNPAMPFTRPFLLQEGRRLALAEEGTGENNFFWRMVTFRGVRLCSF